MASRGQGGSFGEALINAIASAADGTVGVRRSYTAVGWHAQISKLTSSPRGYLAAERAGLSANERTLRNWLSEKVEPNPANQRKIAHAYAIMAGRWPAEVERQSVDIHGEVTIADDSRERGGGSGNAALTIDGREGDWSRMKAQWNKGTPSADDFEEFFVVDVLEADLGEFSDPPEFTGSSYTVVIG